MLHSFLKVYGSESLTLADALIGSTALFYQLPLVTANVKHFRVMDDLNIAAFRP
jgi:predicted nucleic acid-binding protein